MIDDTTYFEKKHVPSSRLSCALLSLVRKKERKKPPSTNVLFIFFCLVSFSFFSPLDAVSLVTNAKKDLVRSLREEKKKESRSPCVAKRRRKNQVTGFCLTRKKNERVKKKKIKTSTIFCFHFFFSLSSAALSLFLRPKVKKKKKLNSFPKMAAESSAATTTTASTSGPSTTTSAHEERARNQRTLSASSIAKSLLAGGIAGGVCVCFPFFLPSFFFPHV